MTFDSLYTLTIHHCSRPFDFSGRLNRQSFWISMLGLLLIQIASLFVSMIGPLAPIAFLVLLYTYLIVFNIGIRRLRDVHKSPWWMLCAFIPLVSLVLPWLFMLGASSDSPYNQYGESNV